MNKEQIENLADIAANVAIAEIQDSLQVRTGDFAGIYFSGDKWAILTTILSGYIRAEISEGAAQ
jgi:hypothetical protein